MTSTPHAWDDPLKCHVGDWIPATAPTVRSWDKKKGRYWYRVGGFICRSLSGAGPVNPAIPWGFELRLLPSIGNWAWVRCC
jgi:hypothetical protein